MTEVPRVTTATEFVAAREAGEVVEFEIAHGYVLRSDVSQRPDFLEKRLAHMLEAERLRRASEPSGDERR